jgi:glyoxylase-like metal-dependent hydrolase (beta-lactamase superfamily II)
MIRALHTPGHTPDHVVFTLEEEGSMFAGDCVLNGNTATFEDLGEYTESLKRMAQELPAGGTLYPSHGDVVTDGTGKLAEYLRHRAMREEMFMDALREDWSQRPERGGMTASELCHAVYARQVSYLVLKTACEGITRQHLGKMTEEGRVRVEGGKGGWGFGGEVRYVPSAGEMARAR